MSFQTWPQARVPFNVVFQAAQTFAGIEAEGNVTSFEVAGMSPSVQCETASSWSWADVLAASSWELRWILKILYDPKYIRYWE